MRPVLFAFVILFAACLPAAACDGLGFSLGFSGGYGCQQQFGYVQQFAAPVHYGYVQQFAQPVYAQPFVQSFGYAPQAFVGFNGYGRQRVVVNNGFGFGRQRVVVRQGFGHHHHNQAVIINRSPFFGFGRQRIIIAR